MGGRGGGGGVSFVYNRDVSVSVVFKKAFKLGGNLSGDQTEERP